MVARLDKQFMPMVKVLDDFSLAVAKEGGKPVVIAVERNDGYISTYALDVYKDGHDEENYGIAERIIKTLLWLRGGFKVYIAGSRVPTLLNIEMDMSVTKLLQMLPYVVTIIVLIVTSVRKKRENQPPASLGLPYFREER